MSQQIQLQAWDSILAKEELKGIPEYSKEWLETAEKYQDSSDGLVDVEGALILGYGTAYSYILEAVRELQGEGKKIFESDEENIIARPEILEEVILRKWSEWHKADDRWLWKEDTIRDFFKFYQWADIIIRVY